MTRSLTIRKPTAAERRRLQTILEERADEQVCRRAEAILSYADGWDAQEIARFLQVHPNTIYADLHAFDEQGLACLHPLPTGGAPAQITPEQGETMRSWAEQTPEEMGLSEGRWTLATFRDFLVQRQRLLPHLSLEHLRRLLKQARIRFQRVQRKICSHDPQRLAILRRIKYHFTHLRDDGLFFFFDVKPVSVKAYGGRRFSAAPRLVLEGYQKTRGFFYLFLAYEVKSGRVRWRYYAHKDSVAVRRFMQQVRRWYPTQEIWVVLDQDPAHPRKSRQTRREMRRLRLHWISLPKASPDDNPVETIFSDIQQMVLDNSNDPNEQATRRRISRRLAGRNRRRNRWIHIPYLD